MNFSITQAEEGLSRWSWDKPDDIRAAVYYSLNIHKGELITAPNFGLDLSDIKKVTDNNIDTIKQRIQQALDWLLIVEKARAIKITVQKNNLNRWRVDTRIEIIQSDSVPITIDNFITVGV